MNRWLIALVVMSVIVAFAMSAFAQTPPKKGESSNVKKPAVEELKKKLSSEQFHVTQECGTEPPFKNAYWDNHEDGIYVDIVSGEPLFSSKDKFDSGTGWPSFTRPIGPEAVIAREDNSHGMMRAEVLCAKCEGHLGHVFSDGPPPARQRYCMNSVAMKHVGE